MKIKELFKFIFYKIIDFNPLLYIPQIDIEGYKFEIHKTDSDPWPSFPHMHSLEDNMVLNIYTGEIYRKMTRDIIGYASEKNMKRLWNDEKFLNEVMEIRKK